eukprot:TRINITY_DN3632_c0_g1_i2.p2 TRINITY_DN3632_c0_g1~~TRINITY_DN3632_c0_g1_i2.p2  ORF type:complete len:170 (+),score=37.79 TRINITY_DN3632_c0_g1_i2:56-511(+)
MSLPSARNDEPRFPASSKAKDLHSRLQELQLHLEAEKRDREQSLADKVSMLEQTVGQYQVSQEERVKSIKDELTALEDNLHSAVVEREEYEAQIDMMTHQLATDTREVVAAESITAKETYHAISAEALQEFETVELDLDKLATQREVLKRF